MEICHRWILTAMHDSALQMIFVPEIKPFTLPRRIDDHKMKETTFYTIVLVPYMDRVLYMDTPNIFKSNKFNRHMVQHIREKKIN